MQGLGDRLRARARDLGWSDAEVARRADLKQTRYANYVTDRHEPDLPTLMRICTVLGTSPSDLLGRNVDDADEAARLRRRVEAAMTALDASALAVLVAVVDGLVARRHAVGAVDVFATKPARRKVAPQA